MLPLSFLSLDGSNCDSNITSVPFVCCPLISCSFVGYWIIMSTETVERTPGDPDLDGATTESDSSETTSSFEDSDEGKESEGKHRASTATGSIMTIERNQDNGKVGMTVGKLTPHSHDNAMLKFSIDNYDKSYWRVSKQSATYRMVYLPTNTTYDVPHKRFNKAVNVLDPRNVAATACVIGKKSCRCSRRCTVKFSIDDILSARYGVCKLASEQIVIEVLAERLRLYRGVTGEWRYKIKDIDVCSTFWRQAHGICNTKLTSIRQHVTAESTIRVHGNSGQRYRTVEEVYAKTTAFWTALLEDLSQDVNETTRLWPTGMTSQMIYDQHFVPYCEEHWPNDDVPSISTFNRAAKDFKYSDVAKRAKHNHVRCTTCTKFRTLIANGQ